MKPELFDIEFLKNEGKHYKMPYVFKYYHTNPPFSDRESYVKWKQEWRDAYKQLSADIRESKINRKKLRRPTDYYQFATRARIGRDIAHQMMDMRMDAKELSMKMRAERLAAQD